MKTITLKEAIATMNGMSFIILNINKELGIETKIEELEEITRSAFESYCKCEHIEEVIEE